MVTKRAFQFNIYSKTASIDIESKKIKLGGVDDEGIIFEVRTEDRPRVPYLTKSFKLSELVKNWFIFYPREEAQPNSFINGFDGKERRLLTLVITNPEYYQVGGELIFDYSLDEVENFLDVDKMIKEWNEQGELKNVSLLVDSTDTSAGCNLTATECTDVYLALNDTMGGGLE